jgi:hypothetical protein
MYLSSVHGVAAQGKPEFYVLVSVILLPISRGEHTVDIQQAEDISMAKIGCLTLREYL